MEKVFKNTVFQHAVDRATAKKARIDVEYQSERRTIEVAEAEAKNRIATALREIVDKTSAVDVEVNEPPADANVYVEDKKLSEEVKRSLVKGEDLMTRYRARFGKS